jgi:cytoskeletal protein CcmA (bactofilin family)
VIASDVMIEGNIVTEGEIQIDGRLKGDILCRRLLIGDTGRIDDEITAESLQIHGQVEGKITASKVVIARSARVTGDIVHDSVEIEAGARLDGRLVPKTPAAVPALAGPDQATALEPARLAPPARSGKAGANAAVEAPPPAGATTLGGGLAADPA